MRAPGPKGWQLIAFLALAFGFTFVLFRVADTFLPFLQSPYVSYIEIGAGFGPSLAAIYLTWAEGGLAGLRDILHRLKVWRVALPWYGLALLLPPVLALGAYLYATLVGSPPTLVLPRCSFASPGCLVIIQGPLGEELGWRGYALPRLQHCLRALPASLALGVVWALWHFPQGWPAGDLVWVALGFLLWILAGAVLHSWVYNSTGGSLLLNSLFHFSTNLTGAFVFFGDAKALWLYYLLPWVPAGAVAVGTRCTLSSPREG